MPLQPRRTGLREIHIHAQKDHIQGDAVLRPKNVRGLEIRGILQNQKGDPDEVHTLREEGLQRPAVPQLAPRFLRRPLCLLVFEEFPIG